MCDRRDLRLSTLKKFKHQPWKGKHSQYGQRKGKSQRIKYWCGWRRRKRVTCYKTWVTHDHEYVNYPGSACRGGSRIDELQPQKKSQKQAADAPPSTGLEPWRGHQPPGTGCPFGWCPGIEHRTSADDTRKCTAGPMHLAAKPILRVSTPANVKSAKKQRG